MDVVEPQETAALWTSFPDEEIRRFLALARRALRAPAALFIPAGRDGGTVRSAAKNTDMDPFATDSGRIEALCKSASHERVFGSLIVVDMPSRGWTAAEGDMLDDVAGCLTSLLATHEASQNRANVAQEELARFAKSDESGVSAEGTPQVRDTASSLRTIIQVAELLKAEQQTHMVAAHARTIQSTAEALLDVGTETLVRVEAQPDHAANGSAGVSAIASIKLDSSEEDAGLPDSAHILIADDLDLNRKLISDMLSVEGHVVDSVADGASAVKAAGENTYDLILMDMIMPGMDGVAATRAIRALPAPACNVPIVALTAHSLPEQLDSCIQAGMNATLTKPMSMDALTDAVATWKRRRRQAA